jgi:drug/metabolite transporter (DMT)-like permease
MLAALLALTASMSWGTSDFLAGLQSRRYSAWAVAAVSQPAAMIGALVVVAARGAGPPHISSLLWPLLAGSTAAAASLSEYQALRLSSMSLVAPIVGGTAVIPFAAGLLAGERPSTLQVAGAILTVAGIVLISGGARREERGEHALAGSRADAGAVPEGRRADEGSADWGQLEAGAARTSAAREGRAGERAVNDAVAREEPYAQVVSAPARVAAGYASVSPAARAAAGTHARPAPARARAVLYALGAAFGFGLLLVAFDRGGKGDPYWTVLAARCSSAVAMGAYIGVRRPSLRLPFKALPAIAVVGLLLAAANTTFTLASTHGNLSVVGILGSLYPAITVGFAALLLRERLAKWQLAAAAMILVGVVCLAAG